MAVDLGGVAGHDVPQQLYQLRVAGPGQAPAGLAQVGEVGLFLGVPAARQALFLAEAAVVDEEVEPLAAQPLRDAIHQVRKDLAVIDGLPGDSFAAQHGRE